MSHQKEDSRIYLDIFSQITHLEDNDPIQVFNRFVGLMITKVHPGNFEIKDHDAVGVQLISIHRYSACGLWNNRNSFLKTAL